MLKFFSSSMDTEVTSMVFTFSHLGGIGRYGKKGQGQGKLKLSVYLDAVIFREKL